MEADRKLIYDTKRLLLARYPRFGSEIASANIEYRTNLKYNTAATDGKNIYFDPNYLASLNDDDRLFLIAHEILHIKFAHTFRLLDKNGQKKDPDTWNEATDAVINANLERDGFKIKKGYINRPEALKYSAEEFYQILLKEKENQKQNNENNQHAQNSEQNDSVEKNDDQRQVGDDHSLWEEAFEKQQEQQEEQEKGKCQGDEQEKKESSSEIFVDKYNEQSEFSENRQERKVRAKENLERMREQMLRAFNKESSTETINLGNVGESKEAIDWKILLRREIEKTETIWSKRRSIAENNYAYRLEENDIEDEAETEVMIDVSGSVDLDLVRGFLRILKPILKHSKLRVGCFNENFWGMTEIKLNTDIDNFVIPEGARGDSAWTEDWDLAVRSFTRRKEINKIVFTDGYPCPGTMPKEDLKNENIIWLVYGNKAFKPCCGKVINITENQLDRLQLCQLETNEQVGRTR